MALTAHLAGRAGRGDASALDAFLSLGWLCCAAGTWCSAVVSRARGSCASSGSGVVVLVVLRVVDLVESFHSPKELSEASRSLLKVNHRVRGFYYYYY